MINYFQMGYEAFVKMAAPGIGVSPVPSPPKIQSPVIANQLGSAVSKPPPKAPVSAVAPPSPPSLTMPAAPASAMVTIPPAPPSSVGQLHMTTETATNRAKQSEFQLQNGSQADLDARHKAPDNGELLLGQLTPAPESDPANASKVINDGFNGLKVQRNFDLPNPGNETAQTGGSGLM
jgi:hypothetical protein